LCQHDRELSTNGWTDGAVLVLDRILAQRACTGGLSRIRGWVWPRSIQHRVIPRGLLWSRCSALSALSLHNLLAQLLIELLHQTTVLGGLSGITLFERVTVTESRG